MPFFCRPLWDCFSCTGAIKLNYQLIAAGHFCQCCFCFYEWKRTDLRHHIQLLIAIFTPYLICRSSCQSCLTLRSNIHKPGRSPDSENHKYKANPALPVIIAVMTSPLPIEQPPAMLAPKPISTPPNPLRNVVCASAARTRNSRLALAAINDPTKIPNTGKRPS